MDESEDFYIAGIIMTKRAVLAADFPKEVLLYAKDYILAELETEDYEFGKQLCDLGAAATKSIQNAFKKPYVVCLFDECGLDASSLEDELTIVVDIEENTASISIH